jgi:adenosylcobyric acid synthase
MLPDDAALVVLPGSKSTIADLAEFRANQWEDDLRRHVARGGMVIGLCGGYQMLGREIADPGGVEGPAGEVEGVGLLDIETVLEGAKTVRNSSAVLAEDGIPLEGYEIHMGQTSGPDCARPFVLIDGRPDGAVSTDGKVRGCYLHGLFSTDAWRAQLIERLGGEAGTDSHRARVEAALDELAAHIETHLDVDGLLAAAVDIG